MASLVTSSLTHARITPSIASRANDGTGRVASRTPAPSSRRMTGRRGFHAVDRVPREGAFASPRRRSSGLYGPHRDDRRWRRFSHPTEPTSGERAGRLVPLAKPPTKEDAGQEKTSLEQVTEKWGLEAGLWNVFRGNTNSGDGDPTSWNGVTKMTSAKNLLKKYGSAYLVTSIGLSIVSISLMYALISAGVDVPFWLDKIGLTVTSTSEKFGTFALAYAAHKALSPVRFPPTVALTPIVAGWLGKKSVLDEEK